MNWQRKFARGFTLIEMAIVMVVIGLLLSGGLVAVAPVLQNSKISETNQRLDRVEQALLLHVIRYGCLPCPADSGLASTNANAGKADIAAGTYYSSGCQASGACAATGVVPWVNLGLSENDITDGFGARIDYTVAQDLQLTNGMVRTPPSTYPSPTTGNGLIVLNYSNIEQTGGADATRAAYVLVSHGPDRFGGYLAQSGSGPLSSASSSSATQTENNDADVTFVQDDVHSTIGSTYFDDIVRWRPAPLIIQLCGTNACGNPA